MVDRSTRLSPVFLPPGLRSLVIKRRVSVADIALMEKKTAVSASRTAVLIVKATVFKTKKVVLIIKTVVFVFKTADIAAKTAVFEMKTAVLEFKTAVFEKLIWSVRVCSVNHSHLPMIILSEEVIDLRVDWSIFYSSRI